MANIVAVIDIQVLLGMKTSTYFSVASATFLTYDYLLMLPTEVQHVWQVKWGVGKVLYLLSRYPLLLVSLVDLHRMTSHVASEKECRVLYTLIYHTMAFATMISEIILIIRVWALWKRRIWVIAVLGSILIAGMITAGIVAEGALRGVDDLCHGFVQNSSMMHTFYKDGLLYFAALLATSIINTTVSLTQPLEYANLLLSAQTSLHSVLSARMLLNLRHSAQRDISDVNSVADPNTSHRRHNITGLRFAADNDSSTGTA
ncbi:hypothetical protein PLEOSDRAFT_1102821 [Pleurotus ostreatus PC15]|uniref:DUF6533 domain-containing protein n=1 Tax=Pleurotus ostreatus (strain PC15) TaxID=1137138 RepID=A0A067NP45_PLEO1|nr:hypothetical protein PLEOSDRAFT_1102821 [Pleurotus ostreatus PC15]